MKNLVIVALLAAAFSTTFANADDGYAELCAPSGLLTTTVTFSGFTKATLTKCKAEGDSVNLRAKPGSVLDLVVKEGSYKSLAVEFAVDKVSMMNFDGVSFSNNLVFSGVAAAGSQLTVKGCTFMSNAPVGKVFLDFSHSTVSGTTVSVLGNRFVSTNGNTVAIALPDGDASHTFRMSSNSFAIQGNGFSFYSPAATAIALQSNTVSTSDKGGNRIVFNKNTVDVITNVNNVTAQCFAASWRSVNAVRNTISASQNTLKGVAHPIAFSARGVTELSFVDNTIENDANIVVNPVFSNKNVAIHINTNRFTSTAGYVVVKADLKRPFLDKSAFVFDDNSIYSYDLRRETKGQGVRAPIVSTNSVFMIALDESFVVESDKGAVVSFSRNAIKSVAGTKRDGLKPFKIEWAGRSNFVPTNYSVFHVTLNNILGEPLDTTEKLALYSDAGDFSVFPIYPIIVPTTTPLIPKDHVFVSSAASSHIAIATAGAILASLFVLLL